MLMLASQLTTASAPELSAPSSTVSACQNSSPPESAIPMPVKAAASTRVTTGPRHGDLELRARRVAVARHPRDAAEQPQRDLGDRDPVARRDHRVAQLVQEDRAEEAERGDHREHVGLGVGGLGAEYVAIDARRGR